MFLNKINDCKSIVKYDFFFLFFFFFEVCFMTCIIHCGDAEAAFHTFSRE